MYDWVRCLRFRSQRKALFVIEILILPNVLDSTVLTLTYFHSLSWSSGSRSERKRGWRKFALCDGLRNSVGSLQQNSRTSMLLECLYKNRVSSWFLWLLTSNFFLWNRILFATEFWLPRWLTEWLTARRCSNSRWPFFRLSIEVP